VAASIASDNDKIINLVKRNIDNDEQFKIIDSLYLVAPWLHMNVPIGRVLGEYVDYPPNQGDYQFEEWSITRKLTFVLTGHPSVIDCLAWNYYIHYFLDSTFKPVIENGKFLKKLNKAFPFTEKLMNDPRFVYRAIYAVIYGSLSDQRTDCFIANEATYARCPTETNKFLLARSATRILLIFKLIRTENKIHHYYRIGSILSAMMKYSFLREIGLDLWNEFANENNEEMRNEIRSELAHPMAALCTPLKGLFKSM